MLPLVLAAVLQSVQPAQTPWDAIFREAGVDAASVQVSPSKWRGGGTYALNAFTACWDDWRKLEPTALGLAHDLLDQAKHPDACLAIAARDVGATLPAANDARARLRLRQAILACGGTSDADLPKLDQALKGVPRDVAAMAATCLAPMPRVAQLRRQAFAWIKSDAELAAIANEALSFAMSYDLGPHCLDLMDKTDVGALAEAGRIIARAAISLQGKRPSGKPFHFEWPTALGRVELSGGGSDAHNLDGALLVMDTGGDDTYAGAPADRSGVTLVVDFAGNDRYRNCGLAVFGVSEIYDFAGDDVYQCDGCGNGGAAFGVSVVYDAAGKDRYSARDLSEGAAVCGIGLLLDLAGDDEYLCRACSQGFGGPRGFSALVDMAGNDKYTADDEHIDNPSPQTAQHNVSMSQGAGFGRRAHPGDGHSMAGGIGILVDAAGDDTYRCGVFGQGVGYWYGMGALVDLGGNDSYDGVWYVQGSAAHYAIGCLLDVAGNDRYLARIAQSQGQGHDYSIGLLHDFAGDDTYTSQGGAMMGSGRWNGLGLFADGGGTNAYTGYGGDCLGHVAEHRPEEACFGLFADLGHAKIANAAKDIAPGRVWFRQRETKAPMKIGAGYAAR